MQDADEAAAGEGKRVHGMISALVAAGIEVGYLVYPRLAVVHWQAGGRALPAPAVGTAGESVLWVDPAEIPSDEDVLAGAGVVEVVAAGDLVAEVGTAARQCG